MALRFTPVVAWLVVLATPFHVLTAVYLDVLGPTHFHLEHGLHDHDHSHGPGHAQRHHHSAGDETVVTVADDARAPEEGNAPGWSATACVGLASTSARLHLARRPNDIGPDRSLHLQTRSLGRLERPPRVASA
jgi:hypothetical protein